MARRGGSLFSLGTVFASFFGAAMIAGAFAYFNYKFSEYKFIDFSEWVFYEKQEIFTPDAERYVVVFFSSKNPKTVETLSAASANYPVIAIDLYQQRFESGESIRFIAGGSNTVLKFVQRFNIYHVPSVFIIKKVKERLYKQDSMIRELDTLEVIDSVIKDM